LHTNCTASSFLTSFPAQASTGRQGKARPWHRQTHGSQIEDLAVLVEVDELNDLSKEQFEVVQSEPEEVQRSSETETPELEKVVVDTSGT